PCRMKYVVIVAWSLLGAPLRRSEPAFMCVVYATSVVPCHSPVVKPPRSCGAFFDGCGRPSIQIVVPARSSQAPIFQAIVVPLVGSVSFQIFMPNGPIAR